MAGRKPDRDKVKLTKRALEKVEAQGDQRTVYWDSDLQGYGVRVMPSGTKTLFVQGRINKTEVVRITIGKFPAVNAEDARKKAQQMLAQIALGNDPRPPKQDTNATFGKLMTAYGDLLKQQGKIDAPRVQKQIARHIEQPHPKLWRKPAAEITLDDCMTVVGRLKDEGKPREADKIRSYIRTAFSAGINSRGDANMPRSMRSLNIKHNPARDMVKVEGSSNAKDRALTLSEFRNYWRRIHALPEPRRSIAILHVLLGGQRQEQLRRVTLHDIDRDAQSVVLWDYKGRRKKPHKYAVPLLPDALDAIERITGGGEYVFSSNGGQTPMGPRYLQDAVRTVMLQMDEAGELEKGTFTAGTIRATVETRLMERPYRVSSDVLARLLSHGLGGIQARHYQHHDFHEEKLEALEMLHRMLEGQSEPSAQVVTMRAVG